MTAAITATRAYPSWARPRRRTLAPAPAPRPSLLRHRGAPVADSRGVAPVTPSTSERCRASSPADTATSMPPHRRVRLLLFIDGHDTPKPAPPARTGDHQSISPRSSYSRRRTTSKGSACSLLLFIDERTTRSPHRLLHERQTTSSAEPPRKRTRLADKEPTIVADGRAACASGALLRRTTSRISSSSTTRLNCATQRRASDLRYSSAAVLRGEV
jgi:hypothetical protein